MIYKIELTKQAEDDLRNIFEYIAYTLLEPESATKTLERIENSILSLSELPNRFKAYENEPWNRRNLRLMPVDNFIVFYISTVEDKTVTIIRILYGGRDIDKHLTVWIYNILSWSLLKHLNCRCFFHDNSSVIFSQNFSFHDTYIELWLSATSAIGRQEPMY